MNERDESWIDAETAPMLTWRKVDKYHQESIPAGYTVCAVKVNGEPYHFEAWRGKSLLRPFASDAATARARCEADAADGWNQTTGA